MKRLWLVVLFACATQTGPIDKPVAVIKPAPPHPLDPLNAEELGTAVEVLKSESKLIEGMFFPILVLHEPAKDQAEPPREAFAVVLDRKNNKTYEAIVDVRAKKSTSWKEIAGVQPGVLIEEFDSPKELVRNDPRWRAAIEKRGIKS
jgi:primary-amine oxidase